MIQGENLAQRPVRLRQRVVELQGLPRRRFRLRNGLVRRERTAKQELHLRQRQLGIRFGEVGLDGDRLLEIPDRPAESVMSLLAPRGESFEVGVVRLRIDRSCRRRPWDGGGARPAATAMSDAICCCRSSIWLKSPS